MTVSVYTGPSRKPPTRNGTRTGVPGTAPAPPRRPTRMSPPNSNARPGALKLAVASLRQQPSSSGRARSRRIQRRGRNARSRAAEAKQLAGAPQAASTLLAVAIDGSLDEFESASAQRLKGQIALDLRRGGEATPLLLEAASRLERVEPTVARKTYLAALFAASFVSQETLRRAAEAARNAPRPGTTPSPDDLMLDGLAIRFTDGYAASASLIKQALRAYRDQDSTTVEDVRWPGIARRIAPDLLDDEIWHDLVTRSAALARERGALGVLPLALSNLAFMRIFAGELTTATPLLDEADAIADATDGDRITFGWLILAAFRGDESALSEHVETDKAKAIARGEGLLPTVGQHASALLHNGLGRYDAALTAAEAASRPDAPLTTVWSLPELVEAASRCGNQALALDALERLAERTQAAGTEWALGIEARSRALLNDGPAAEELYREAIDRLARCRIATERARTHLLYGEWLRRAGRRVDARGQLRAAHDMLSDFGMDGFAERARRELIATGDKPRKRSPETEKRPHCPGRPDRPTRAPGLLEPGDRRPAVPQPTHRRVAHAQGLRQTRHQLSPTARHRSRRYAADGTVLVASPRQRPRSSKTQRHQVEGTRADRGVPLDRPANAPVSDTGATDRANADHERCLEKGDPMSTQSEGRRGMLGPARSPAWCHTTGSRFGRATPTSAT